MYTKNFVLHGGDSAFANRQKLLFDQLAMAEKNCNKDNNLDRSNVEMEVEDTVDCMQLSRIGTKRKRETQKLRGKQSIFKRPEAPAPRSAYRNISHHHMYPHKWTKYSLDDVSNDDMSERSNTQAALSFLKELKARKVKEQPLEESMNIDNEDESKIVFKSRKNKSTAQIQFQKPKDNVEKTENSAIIIGKDDKPIFRSTKIILPEYVVGQKQKKKDNKKNKPAPKVDHTKVLKLDHLEESYDDDV